MQYVLKFTFKWCHKRPRRPIIVAAMTYIHIYIYCSTTPTSRTKVNITLIVQTWFYSSTIILNPNSAVYALWQSTFHIYLCLSKTIFHAI